MNLELMLLEMNLLPKGRGNTSVESSQHGPLVGCGNIPNGKQAAYPTYPS